MAAAKAGRPLRLPPAQRGARLTTTTTASRPRAVSGTAIRQDTTLGGEWMATCGVILGAVELALTALAVIAFVGFFAIVSVHTSTP
jgi:hypothetical protein